MSHAGTSTIRRAFACLLWIATIGGPATAQEPPGDHFPEIFNTQEAGQDPPTPEESARAFRVPDGFQVTLFAGEPDVQQPICFAFDDRGRIWVAECYSYAEGRFTDKQQDRIIILADRDGDGRHDERKVFWQGGHVLSSIVWGFDGLYMLEDGKLQHMPDADRDDVPDGPPTVLLDGFDKDEVGHNIASGLMWGPDGWLYGRHGIQATSHVGPPGTPQEERTSLNASIWRYHPTRHTFEVLTHGTTNPWGLDYNDVGEFFFTNNVIGHLWHMIPGAHYKRMYGADFNPHVYELIDQTADHYHWDREGYSWNEARRGEGETDEFGGGHSHCGGMIYLGDNWPDEYRGRMFMCNTHGRRINQDILERRGVGYVARHGTDFAFAGNEWFRGVQLAYGPDGGVFLSDWSDLGECHDTDGTHRTSGRIYKITYGDPKPVDPDLDVASLSNDKLVELQLHKNDWYVRHARRTLQERAARGEDIADAEDGIWRIIDHTSDTVPLLRAYWALNVIGHLQVEQLWKLHGNPHLEAWYIRLLAEAEDLSDLSSMACHFAESPEFASHLGGLYIASSLRKLAAADAIKIANELLKHKYSEEDRTLPLMVWYGLEPHFTEHWDACLEIFVTCQSSFVRQAIARRATSLVDTNSAALESLVVGIGNDRQMLWHIDAANYFDVLQGMVSALRGRVSVPAPRYWNDAYNKLRTSDDDRVKELAQELAIVFGDGRALDDLLDVVRDADRDVTQRRDALAALAEHRAEGLVPMLFEMLGDPAMAPVAARGLANYDHRETARQILRRWGGMKEDAREAAITTLCSRPQYAKRLLDAVARDRVPREAIDVIHARQIQSLGDDELATTLDRVWGSVRVTPAEKRGLIERLKSELTDQRLAAANLANGRELFQKKCATCHKLFGEGEAIGPDLTGSDRRNVQYVLENVVDPSAVVPEAHRISIVQTTAGRTITGVVLQESGQTVTVQTEKEQVIVPRGEVESMEMTPLSLMPDGLLADLSDDDVRDLVAFLGKR